MICQRLPQIACSDDDHLVLLIQSQDRAYLIIKAIHTVAVSLLAESSEIIEILPYLRCSVPGQIAELAVWYRVYALLLKFPELSHVAR